MKTGFFEEAPEKKSMMRLCSFILLMIFMVLNTLYFLDLDGKEISMNFIMWDFIMLVGVFVPKALQKLTENKFMK